MQKSKVHFDENLSPKRIRTFYRREKLYDEKTCFVGSLTFRVLKRIELIYINVNKYMAV